MKKLIFALSLLVCAQFANAQYNASGYGLKGNVKFVEESVYEYVEKFGETEIGKMFGRKCMHFNDGGLISKKYVISGDKNSRDTSEISTFEYVYNEKSQIKELNEYRQYANGYRGQKTLKYKSKYKFDDAGNVIQGIKYNGDGSFYNGYKYVYANGELTESIAINSDGSDNEDGYDYQNNYESRLYDDFNYDDEDVTNKDVIDNVGNWIKRIVFNANKQERGMERRIIYF
jgi:hypothetical protein